MSKNLSFGEGECGGKVAQSVSFQPARPVIMLLFVASRDYLEHITSIGPRTTGSPENEILTVHYLLEQIKLIEAQSNSLHKISVDVQRPTGSFSIDFLGMEWKLIFSGHC